MWSPTHIQVTVQRAKGLLTKGKNGTNNCFVTIGLGKEKYQTSVKEKAETNVSWNEECELKIPDQGNRAELVLTCLHKNNLGIDEFLGQATLPLNEMDVYDRPRSKWFKLESKPGKEKKNKERGELEVRISFIVKSGSLTDLSKKEKHKSSIGQLASSVGGSLLSIGTIEKRKGIKKFAKSLGSKMHLNSKKKNKDGDDASSFNGSFVSIGTPNSSAGGNRRYGQHAGDADPGVISEDEDEFVFDNLSHKSSASSLNVRSAVASHLHATPTFTVINPAGLMVKPLGKQLESKTADEIADISQMETTNTIQTAHTLPPPSKPPRTPQLGTDNERPTLDTFTSKMEKPTKVDEWETKLYGKHLDISGADSLKRRSWELNPVPLPVSSDDIKSSPEEPKDDVNQKIEEAESDSSITSDEEGVPETSVKEIEPTIPSPKVKPRLNLLSPEEDSARNNFNRLNATFAHFEQQNSSKIFDNSNGDVDAKKWRSQAFINEEAEKTVEAPPQAKPRNKEPIPVNSEFSAGIFKQQSAEVDEILIRKVQQEEETRKRAEEDARLEEELRLNEQRLCEEEEALKAELKQQEDAQQLKRELKHREEDEKILNFSRKPSLPTEGAKEQIHTNFINYGSSTPEQSPKQRIGDNREKRFGKFKYFNRKDKIEGGESSSSSPKSNERIIIGHEKSTSHAERRSEITAALAKKYEGKSREELMLIANGMENEALLQRQRVKELEDYLDNLLLRVMETHPKLLQNPYSRTTSAKSG